ncbi:hypothetical protein [Streptomyces sp. P17]|uniref:hypothetical protein n=1 Tax=Streptomyces sp. P17 TaxID=3074716 RepID=UPI0028F40180|nr:hypothetical protein [Streptomyces sp. P17]MDT9698580.1 hypothetical protein [Streptomyces sp. P17]
MVLGLLVLVYVLVAYVLVAVVLVFRGAGEQAVLCRLVGPVVLGCGGTALAGGLSRVREGVVLRRPCSDGAGMRCGPSWLGVAGSSMLN